MRAADLRLAELLDAPPEGGILRFAGQRALLFDAVALGLLRRELIRLLGHTAARGLLTRFGYGHGWRTAESLRGALPWDDEREWRSAGGRLHRLQGHVAFEPAPDGVVADREQAAASDDPAPQAGGLAQADDDPAARAGFAAAVWRDSYEAAQHLLHVGPSDEPVCWTLTGFASGYLSRATGRAVYCVEEACVARGDAVCRMVGRPREAWGPTIEPHLPYFEQECLDAALQALRDELRQTERRLRATRRQVAAADTAATVVGGLVVRSEALRGLVEQARRVAAVDATVLVTGESGSGKERIARLLHDHSPRAEGPFVAVNCGALPDPLLEAELFGHARGAFTGAGTDRAGLFEAAHHGTLFLDEVGEVSAALQVKLLRALEERRVRRLGETRDRPVDVRIVAATNRDLAQAVREGRIREDFYYRLRVVELRIPPLRERREDILPLAHHFLALAAERFGRRLSGFTGDASERLLRHDWPGNVRELRNAVEHAAVFARDSRVEAADLPPSASPVAGPPPAASAETPPGPAAPPAASERLEEVERAHILAVLAATGGNRAAAARRLGIGTATLFRKLKAWGVG